MTERVLFGPGGATEDKQDQIKALVELLSQESTQIEVRDLLLGALLVVDASEVTDVIYQEINFNGAGSHTIIVAAPTERIRIRRFLLTGGDPDAEPPANPVLSFSLGGQSIRTTALIGRFDILGDAGEDLVITASKVGQVDGTVAYKMESA